MAPAREGKCRGTEAMAVSQMWSMKNEICLPYLPKNSNLFAPWLQRNDICYVRVGVLP